MWHSPTMWLLFSTALPQGHICAFTSSSSQPLVHLLFLAGPGPLHEIALSEISRSPMGRANTFSFQLLLLAPRKSLGVPPSSPLLLSTRRSLIFILSSTYILCPANLPMGSIYLLGFLLYPSILSRLRYPTLFQLALLLLSPPCSPISFGWQPLFWHVPCFILPFQLSHVFCVLSGYIPSSALNTVFLVVLEHRSTFLATVICTASSCFTNFAFPSHTSA